MRLMQLKYLYFCWADPGSESGKALPLTGGQRRDGGYLIAAG